MNLPASYGNFNNVALGGAKVYIDGYQVGYCDGDIEFMRNAVVKKLKDMVPLITVGQAILSEEYEVKIPAVESTIANLSKCSLNIPVTTNAGGTPVVVAFGLTPAASQAFTFAYLQGGAAMQAIFLSGGTLTNVVVKDVSETTTYTLNTDYFTDAAVGVIWWNPGGTIPANATVHVAYHYTPVASQQLNLGVNLPISYRQIYLSHLDTNSGDWYEGVLWSCNGAGTLNLSFKKEDWFKIPMQFTALPTANAAPVGIFRITPYAGVAAQTSLVPIYS